MCDRKNRCEAATAAKEHVGEWCLPLDAQDAGNVQYVMDECAREGIALPDVPHVLIFCLMTVANICAARASFDLTDLTGRGAGS